MKDLKNCQLGKKTKYITEYSPQLLFAIPRETSQMEQLKRAAKVGSGFDIWNAYELSWLDEIGKPQTAIGRFILSSNSPNIIESKSMKLFLNSLNNTKFPSKEQYIKTIQQDLSTVAGQYVDVTVNLLDEIQNTQLNHFHGICIDNTKVTISEYQVNAHLLKTEPEVVTETLYSNLLKSNCPVTGQPDWASIQIHYHGKKINSASLLKYIISYRNHAEFHEQCTERFFTDIINQCQPEQLTVKAQYTRRGGLDINPIRSTEQNISVDHYRQPRQ